MKKIVAADDFIARVAARAMMPIDEVWAVFGAFEIELVDAALAGDRVYFGAIGRFESRVKKGHFVIERYGQPPIILKKKRLIRLEIDEGFERAINPTADHAHD